MEELFAPYGAAPRAALAPIRGRLAGLLRSGRLERPHPGVYVLSAVSGTPLARIHAAQLWSPGSVVVGRAARFLTGEPVRFDVVDLAVRTGVVDRPGIATHRISVPDVWHHGPLTLAGPAWNALWEAGRDGGDAIDAFLRRGGRLQELIDLLPAFRGMLHQSERRRVLRASRAEPWSQLERQLHALLWQAKVHGWTTNHPVRLATGRYVLDVAFPRVKVAIELDGWEHHGSRQAFESDRRKQSDLAAAGWLVLRFTWAQLTEDPGWVVACIRDAVRHMDRHHRNRL